MVSGPRKIVSPIAAHAAASRSLTRHAGRRARLVSCDNEEAIMTIEQHIEELRAELSGITDRQERAQIEHELQLAQEHMMTRLECL